MKTKALKLATLALLPAALFAFTSCSTISGTEDTEMIETPDGAIMVDTFTTVATVTGIDATKRKLTLVFPTGTKTSYKAGPAIVNFSQIQIGDQVKAVVTEEVAVFIGTGTPPSAMAGAGVALAPVGAKPGGVFVDTMQVTAKVTAINAKKHKVTLLFPDNTSKQVKVGKKVNLANLPLGTDVSVQVSEGLAISVEKP